MSKMVTEKQLMRSLTKLKPKWLNGDFKLITYAIYLDLTCPQGGLPTEKSHRGLSSVLPSLSPASSPPRSLRSQKIVARQLLPTFGRATSRVE